MKSNTLSRTNVSVNKSSTGSNTLSNEIKKKSKPNHSKAHTKKSTEQKSASASVCIEPTPDPDCLDEQMCDEFGSSAQPNTEDQLQSEKDKGGARVVELEIDTFRAHFHKYIEFIACKTIGDHGTYLKHLQKEKKNNNTAAAAQIEAISYFECLANTLRSIEEKLEMIANNQIVYMITALRNSPTPPITLKNYWCVCRLTGMPSNELTEVSANFKVDAKFGPLTMALWLCLHLEVMEQNRVETFTANHTKQSFISEIIESYLKSDTAMSMCDVYHWAFEKTFGSFDKTLQTLTEVIKRAKDIQSI